MQALNEHKVKPQCEFRDCDTGPLNEHEAKPKCEFSGVGELKEEFENRIDRRFPQSL